MNNFPKKFREILQLPWWFLFLCMVFFSAQSNATTQEIASTPGRFLAENEFPDLFHGIEAIQGGRLDIALELLEPMARTGVIEAQSLLGRALIGADSDYLVGEGLRWLEHAAIRNDWQALLKLSQLYESGEFVRQDPQMAGHWLALAVRGGGDEAQDFLKKEKSDLLSRAKQALEQKQFDKAKSMLMPLANLGLVEAQETLAGIYKEGLLGKKKKYANYWYAKAAMKGSQIAKYQLAMQALERKDIDAREKDVSLSMLKQAARPGVANAQYQLGVMSIRGELVAKDPKDGIKWYELAASQGHSEAQYALGVRNLLGIEGEKDPVESHRWFKKAAQNGHVKAQHNLALSYKHGIGTEKNEKLASYWNRRDDKESVKVSVSPISPPFVKHEEKKKANSSLWIEKENNDHYTLQLGTTLKRSSADAIVANLNLNKEKVIISKRKIKGKDWHIVHYGSYKNMAQANKAIEVLRKQNKGISPVIRRIGRVKEHLASG